MDMPFRAVDPSFTSIADVLTGASSGREPESTGAGAGAFPAIDISAFKSALGSFATGVTLATTAEGGEFHGATANAVLSVSLDPPLVLISIQNETRMCLATRRNGNFALSMLSSSQRYIAEYFANSSQPHGTVAFSRFPHHSGPSGAPLLEGALAHVDCRVVESYVAGDHTLFLPRPRLADRFQLVNDLIFHRRKQNLSP